LPPVCLAWPGGIAEAGRPPLLGDYAVDGQLLYASTDGIGVSVKTSRLLRGRLAALAVQKMPLAAAPPRGIRFDGLRWPRSIGSSRSWSPKSPTAHGAMTVYRAKPGSWGGSIKTPKV